MALQAACDSSFSFGADCFNRFDPVSCSFYGFSGFTCGGSALPRSSIALDDENRELVKTPASTAKKTASSEKALAAMRSHSEAERRRRERINSQLATLRGLVPCADKKHFDIDAGVFLNQMDKATLLAEVINQVKGLKRDAIEATRGLLVPMDADEVTVEPCEDDEAGHGSSSIRASVCCEYRPTLLSEIRNSLEELPLKLVKAEISTVGGRLKNVFVLTSRCHTREADVEANGKLIDSVRRSLDSVLDKASDSSVYCPRSAPPSKRLRVSSSDSLSSSP